MAPEGSNITSRATRGHSHCVCLEQEQHLWQETEKKYVVTSLANMTREQAKNGCIASEKCEIA